MSKEDEFELNYVKIDGKNEIKLLGGDDYAAEVSTFFSTVTEFEQEKIAKKVIKEIEKTIPEKIDLFKSNIDFAKKFLKLINTKKNNNDINKSVNRILSLDFRNQFIFNYTNIFDVCCIVSLFFSEIKKFKISSIEELKKRIKTINLQKYDYFRLYINAKSLSSKKDTSSFSFTNHTKSTDNSSMKDLKDNIDSIFENEEVSFDKKMYDIMIQKNIKSNSILNSEEGYLREETQKKILTKENFLYPNYNKYKELKITKTDLPIELQMLLYKLREVKCLVFQIQSVENNFKKLAIFILSNLSWLFIKGIEEVKFDLGNEKIQQELDKAFESRTEDLYTKNDIKKNNIHFEGSYRARSVNCWEPEGDIFFSKETYKNGVTEYVYNNQMTDECIIHDENFIGNIYNEFGTLTNIKYIIPINNYFKNKENNELLLLSQQSEQRSTLKYFDEEEFNSTIEKFNESISIFDIDNPDLFEQRNSLNSNSNNLSNTDSNNDFSNKNSTPFMLRDFTNQYKSYFKMILVYSEFFTRNLKNIQKLNLFFHTSFCYEMYICFKTNLNLELTHFLIFLNKIDSLREVNFSFNSLDDKSFEYILGILFKNTHLNILRLSFFSPDINYYDNALFNLCSAKRISLTKLFSEFDEYLKKHDEYSEMKINDFILEEKLLNSLEINFTNLCTLLKLQLLKNLRELVLRFDIPIPIQNNPSYIILIIKFLMNILIMITFQQNQTHTVKILAPNLELNCNQYPYIRSFFQEISLTDEVDKLYEINEIEKEKKKRKEKELLEQKNKLNEKEKDLKQKNEIQNKLGDSDIITQIPQEKNEIDINKNMENYDSSKRYKSMMQKSTSESAAIRRKSTEVKKTESKSRKLNPNDSLEYLVIQMKIFYLPEIFNICKINNLSGLKSINLGYLDEISFKGFVTDYKLNAHKLTSLISIKINLGFSVLNYKDLEDYILDYIYINTPPLEEKFLLSNLLILNESKMKELIELIYLKADVQKLIFTINNKCIDLLSKLLSKFIIEYKTRNINVINSIVLLMEHPKYQNLNKLGLSKYLSDFITLNKNRRILCNENP